MRIPAKSGGKLALDSGSSNRRIRRRGEAKAGGAAPALPKPAQNRTVALRV